MTMTFGSHINDHNDRLEPLLMTLGPFRLATAAMACVVVGIVLFAIFCSINTISNLAEEYPTRAGKVLHAVVLCVMAVHVLVLLVEPLSYWCSLVSLVTNALYLRTLRHFPRVSFGKPFAMLLVTFFVVESMSWLCVLAASDKVLWEVGQSNAFLFIVMTWLAPVGLVLIADIEPICIGSLEYP
ncbi:unnamed protein product [Trypanosoma congolense IL3000]|uniref:WGS project CAEQ00000000 data, annotated contig 466 n=1 Tax=Trypanosoma congolense (strain IL3000) TaxID=1068625 RepID=F9WG56_TRYCI|nr:unnamed protein product [Trypanosoma congolense IL3000]